MMMMTMKWNQLLGLVSKCEWKLISFRLSNCTMRPSVCHAACGRYATGSRNAGISPQKDSHRIPQILSLSLNGHWISVIYSTKMAGEAVTAIWKMGFTTWQPLNNTTENEWMNERFSLYFLYLNPKMINSRAKIIKISCTRVWAEWRSVSTASRYF